MKIKYSDKMNTLGALFIILLSISLLNCTANKQYRTDYKLCITAQPSKECTLNAIQRYHNPQTPDENYLLGFVEFDDQGQYHDRTQARLLLDRLYNDAYKKNLLIVVFVHGWQHNAKQNDEYIVHFRDSLRQLSLLESASARHENRKAKEVAGIFVGWRGQSISVPLINLGTFWDRKATAHQIGDGAISELFSRLEELRNIKVDLESSANDSTRLVIIGHSFGGAIVYTALSQIFMERFIQTQGPTEVVTNVRGFGDLMVLINPAFEALRFANLSDMANERGYYYEQQRPVMTVLTSESDLATKYAFPSGRFFSTLFESHRDVSRFNRASSTQQSISQASADRTAIGHFAPYRTHYLRHKDMQQDSRDIEVFKRVHKQWQADAPGSTINFNGSLLEHQHNSVSRNPYLVVQVDKKIIPDHSDIFDPRVAELIRHFIMISTRQPQADAPKLQAPAASAKRTQR